ncbi:hypothetical protein ACHAXR_004126 [Thalassiosira sp. AJA248-18]
MMMQSTNVIPADYAEPATVVRTVVAVPPHEMFTDVNSASDAKPHDENKKKRRIWHWLLGLGTATVTVILILLLRKKWRFAPTAEELELVPTTAPTSAGDEECRKKRIKITEICNVPDLDEGQTMEIKILVNDQHYWPKQVETDCMKEYGSSYQDSCVVADSSVAGCFPLRNSIEIPFGLDSESIGEQIKVTIVDTDFFWDDLVEVFVPKEGWYRPNLCEKKELEFAQSSYEGSARIKMVVDFGEVENPCGVEEEAIISGLGDAAAALENVQLGLLEYVKAVELKRRRLIFPLLATGFRFMAGAVASGGRSFVRLFTRQTRLGNALSTTADMTEIGSLLFSVLGDNKDAPLGSNNNEALFDKVFDRFDQIDSQLDSIQVQIRDGFKEIKLVVEEEFAQQELDDWITFRLGIKLKGDYQGYMDRSHTSLTREKYEDTFRETCNGDHSPYNIFQVLYSYSCRDCQRFGGKAKNFFLDTYINLAKANFETPMERVLWFRRSFGTVIIGALTEAIYFYSVCLYRSSDECKVVDPVWDARLQEMGDALEEVVIGLGEAETKLE